jgi:hypothetical protein
VGPPIKRIWWLSLERSASNRVWARNDRTRIKTAGGMEDAVVSSSTYGFSSEARQYTGARVLSKKRSLMRKCSQVKAPSRTCACMKGRSSSSSHCCLRCRRPVAKSWVAAARNPERRSHNLSYLMGSSVRSHSRNAQKYLEMASRVWVCNGRLSVYSGSLFWSVKRGSNSF